MPIAIEFVSTRRKKIAVDVVPGETYYIYIADRKALLPDNDKRGLPVTVPWVKLE